MLLMVAFADSCLQELEESEDSCVVCVRTVCYRSLTIVSLPGMSNACETG